MPPNSTKQTFSSMELRTTTLLREQVDPDKGLVWNRSALIQRQESMLGVLSTTLVVTAVGLVAS